MNPFCSKVMLVVFSPRPSLCVYNDHYVTNIQKLFLEADGSSFFDVLVCVKSVGEIRKFTPKRSDYSNQVKLNCFRSKKFMCYNPKKRQLMTLPE
jgi:hypothetical protein